MICCVVSSIQSQSLTVKVCSNIDCQCNKICRYWCSLGLKVKLFLHDTWLVLVESGNKWLRIRSSAPINWNTSEQEFKSCMRSNTRKDTITPHNVSKIKLYSAISHWWFITILCQKFWQYNINNLVQFSVRNSNKISSYTMRNVFLSFLTLMASKTSAKL